MEKIFETKNGVKLFIDLTNYKYKTVGGTPKQVKNALRQDMVGKDPVAKQFASSLLYVMEDMDGDKMFRGLVSFT